jgi:UDP-N-acetylmuramate: L-alanyl-gamma-D-glutamyl-meso-diaminopimelate ligase
MAALAGLLHDSGCLVTGSDRALYPPTSVLLEELGLTVHAGFDPRHLDPAPDLVVIGNAVVRGNPEAEEVLDRRLRCTSMPRIIAERFLEGRHSIVVAGTHGKTTTTSMLAWVLQHAGRSPGFLVGGIPGNFDRSYQLGTGDAFVIEGDEYDTAFFDKGPKFMHYRPDTALVGTVEFDHADIYRDIEQIETVFRRFTNIVPRRGLLVRDDDCGITREVTRCALSRVEGYGLEAGQWRAEDLRHGPDGTTFRVTRDGAPFADARLRVGGDYNVKNALAVVAASVEQGLSPDEIVAGLASFQGVRRRMEVRGEVDGVTVLDDFAHHPTAIGETLRGARGRFPDRKLWAVLEPRSWSLRRNVFQDRLVSAFDAADGVVIAGIFAADKIPDGERLDPERLADEISSRGRDAVFIPSADEIVTHLAGAARPGDVVVIMSNGGFDGIHQKLLAALESRST